MTRKDYIVIASALNTSYEVTNPDNFKSPQAKDIALIEREGVLTAAIRIASALEEDNPNLIANIFSRSIRKRTISDFRALQKREASWNGQSIPERLRHVSVRVLQAQYALDWTRGQ